MTTRRTIVGKLPAGADLYEGLTAFIRREKIRLGRIQGIGATTHAVVAYYNQERKAYENIEFPGGMEILSLSGNVSLRDGLPFLHAHIVLGDSQGRAFGGHLLPGTLVFAFEAVVDELDGDAIERTPDERSGLWLWAGNALA